MSITTLVIYFFLEIFMLYVMFICYSILSKKELKKSKILYSLLFAFIIVLNNIYTIIEARLLVSLVLSILLNKIMFESTINESCLYTIIYFLISFILELLLVPIFTIFEKSNINIFNNSMGVKILFSIIESFFVIKIFKNKIFSNVITKILISIQNKINYNKIVTIVILLLNLLTIIITSNLVDKNILLLSVSILIFVLLVSKTIIEDKYNIVILKELNSNLKSSSKAYSKTIDECRELKHNLKNDLIGIKSFVPKEYHNEINELILKYNKRYEWISKIDDIPEGIQGVIYLKSNEAKKKYIKMFIDVKENIKNINKDYFELSSILGIVLDNAIENSKDSKEKVISVYINSVKNKLNIEIINTFCNIIDIDKLGNKNYSTKREKSGLGLNYIKGLKKRNIKVKYEIINNLFKTNITYNY